MKPLNLFTFATSLLFLCCNNTGSGEQAQSAVTWEAIPVIPWKVVASFRHDSTFFTEGLFFHNGLLYESTGSPDDMPELRSMIVTTELHTGKNTLKTELDKYHYFGEGITLLNGKVYHLTYKNRTGFVYDANTFKKLQSFPVRSIEGWGLTNDGKYLIMSDGTSDLTYLDSATLKPAKTLTVTENRKLVTGLNELEVINGAIYANVWPGNTLVKIDAATGKITGKLDLTELAAKEKTTDPDNQVLNGIAWDAAGDKVYITGKLWSHSYELQFAH